MSEVKSFAIEKFIFIQQKKNQSRKLSFTLGYALFFLIFYHRHNILCIFLLTTEFEFGYIAFHLGTKPN